MCQKAKAGGKDFEKSNCEEPCKDLKGQSVELKRELNELVVLCAWDIISTI